MTFRRKRCSRFFCIPPKANRDYYSARRHRPFVNKYLFYVHFASTVVQTLFSLASCFFFTFFFLFQPDIIRLSRWLWVSSYLLSSVFATKELLVFTGGLYSTKDSESAMPNCTEGLIVGYICALSLMGFCLTRHQIYLYCIYIHMYIFFYITFFLSNIIIFYICFFYANGTCIQ